MIFKQIDEIVRGSKTQTRRLVGKDQGYGCVKNDDPTMHIGCSAEYRLPEGYHIIRVYGPTGKLKWETGRDYAVVPGRGKPGVWWRQTGDLPHQYAYVQPDEETGRVDYGYQPLRIRITAIRQERLQDISEEDAIAEGVEVPMQFQGDGVGNYGTPPDVGQLAYEAYRVLWYSINTRKGTRWQDNPSVWVLSFEVVA